MNHKRSIAQELEALHTMRRAGFYLWHVETDFALAVQYVASIDPQRPHNGREGAAELLRYINARVPKGKEGARPYRFEIGGAGEGVALALLLDAAVAETDADIATDITTIAKACGGRPVAAADDPLGRVKLGWQF